MTISPILLLVTGFLLAGLTTYSSAHVELLGPSLPPWTPPRIIPECVKVDNCSCRLPNGSEINISSLGHRNGNVPRFGYKPAPPDTVPPEWWPWEYAYNPCRPFTDENTEKCKNVIACQRSPTDHTLAFNIGGPESKWTIRHGRYEIHYEHVDRIKRVTKVTLECDPSAEEPTLVPRGALGTGTNYYFTLTTKCACPGMCQEKSTLPTNTSDGNHYDEHEIHNDDDGSNPQEGHTFGEESHHSHEPGWNSADHSHHDHQDESNDGSYHPLVTDAVPLEDDNNVGFVVFVIYKILQLIFK